MALLIRQLQHPVLQLQDRACSRRGFLVYDASCLRRQKAREESRHSLSDSASSAQAPATRSYPQEEPKAPLAILLLLILVVMVPIEFSLKLGSLSLTASRLYLVFLTFMILPYLGEVKLRAFDWFFIGHVAWTCVAYAKIYGVGGAVEMSGSYFLEFLTVYLAARIYLKTLGNILSVIRLLFYMFLIAGALALPEALTGIRYPHELASAITGNTYRIDYSERLGIVRAVSLFEHPILYGIFCASLFSLVWFTSTRAERVYKAPLIVAATWLSASSAPLLTVMVQAFLIAGERLTRQFKMRRDRILAALALSFFLFVQFFVGRGLVGVLALLTISPGTAYTRQSQWDYSIDDVMRSPWFGFIPGTYTRPFWLAPSIDNWWLLIIMRSGIPSLILLALSVLCLWSALARRKSVSKEFINVRLGWGLMMLALLLGAATVTFFGKLQPLFAFYMGFGGALATCLLPQQDVDAFDAPTVGGQLYTRFPKKIAGVLGQSPPSPPSPQQPGAPYSRRK